MAKGDSWIDDVMSKPGAKGALHRNLGVPAGQKIPAKKLKAAEHSKNPKVRKEAIAAENMKKRRG